MNRSLISIIMLVGVLAFVSGCAKDQTSRVRAQFAGEQGAVDMPDLSLVQTDSVAISPPIEEEDDSAHLFADAYREAGSPKICVFFNDELSPNTSEWVKLARVDWASYMEKTKANAPLNTTAGSTATTTLVHEGRAVRPDFWDQVREDVFLEGFNRAGVQFVDSRLVLRKLVAHRNLESRTAKDADDYRTLEMKAIEDSVDIIIEVLSTVANGQAIYHAKALRVSDGVVVGTATTWDRPRDIKPKILIPGTDKVMEEQEEPSESDDLRYLSRALMRRMAGGM